jgi:hypothetical protein
MYYVLVRRSTSESAVTNIDTFYLASIMSIETQSHKLD